MTKALNELFSTLRTLYSYLSFLKKIHDIYVSFTSLGRELASGLLKPFDVKIRSRESGIPESICSDIETSFQLQCKLIYVQMFPLLTSEESAPPRRHSKRLPLSLRTYLVFHHVSCGCSLFFHSVGIGQQCSVHHMGNWQVSALAPN